MLANAFLGIMLAVGVSYLGFFLSCLYKQFHVKLPSRKIIQLFPEEDMYHKNAYENDLLEMFDSDKDAASRWAAIQRGSVRIANGSYYSTSEYKKYKEKVSKMELP